MKITGELLKTERVNKGLSVQSVAQSLKLSAKIISAIEAGDQNQLPAKTFVRGFVKSYAEFLKLDPDVVLRQFQEEMGSTSPLPKVPPPKPAPVENIRSSKPALRQTSQNPSQAQNPKYTSVKEQNIEEQNLNNRILYFLVGAIGLVLVIVLGAKFFDTGSNEVPISATNSENDTTNIIIPTFETVDPNNLATAASQGSSQAANTASTATASTTTLTASAPTGAPTAPATQAAEATTPFAEEEIAASEGKPIELILEAKKDIDIFYAKGNSKLYKSIKLTPSRIQIIRSPAGLHIKASDGGAFRITANGVDIGPAGPSNKPVKLSF